MKKSRKSIRSAKKYYARSRFLTLTARHIIWSLAIFVIPLLIYFLFVGNFFSVKTISCRYAQQACPNPVVMEINDYLGKAIITLKSREVEERIKKNHPDVLKVSVKTLLPNKLEVRINPREALVGIASGDAEILSLVDESGFVFADTSRQQTDVQTISIKNETGFRIGDKINDSGILNAIGLVKICKNYYILFQNLEILNDRLKMKINDKLTVLFPLSQDDTLYQKKVTSLQQILTQVTIDCKPILIDLRFEKPIIAEE